MNRKIVIVDYGMGNLHSLKRMVSHHNIPVTISNKASELLNATHIILPGVGHFGQAMEQLKRNELIEVLNHLALEEKRAFLGICLGMQLMTSFSEEGDCEGLGWFQCNTLNLQDHTGRDVKIPHLGWNTLSIKNDNKILADISSSDEMYFVHGFGVVEAMEEQVLCTTAYGVEFVSGLFKNNLVGVQFHPEKSHENGQRILSNFIRTCIDHE
jgi:glutamine amidotransferase